MPIYTLQQPVKQIGRSRLDIPLYSYWNAAHNDVWHSFLRADYLLSEIANYNNTGFVGFKIDWGTGPVITIDETLIDINIFIGGSGYNKSGTITDVDIFAGYFVTDIPYVGAASNAYINLSTFTGHFIEARISSIKNNVTTVLGTKRFTAGTDGVALVDSASLIRSQLTWGDAFLYDQTDWPDIDRNVVYVIEIRESFRTGGELSIGEWQVAGSFGAVQSKHQAGQKFGANMGEYVTMYGGDIYNGSLEYSLQGWAEQDNNTGGGYFKLLQGIGLKGAFFYALQGGSCELVNTVSEFKPTFTYNVSFKFTADLTQARVKITNGTHSVVGDWRTAGTYSEELTVPVGTTSEPYRLVIECDADQNAEETATIQWVKVEGLPHNAKFLTHFERPTWFNNYPFSLSYIHSEYISGAAVQKIEQLINPLGIAYESLDYNLSKGLGVTRLMLNGGYNCSETSAVETWLEVDGNIKTDCYVQDDYVLQGYHVCPQAGPGPQSQVTPIPTGFGFLFGFEESEQGTPEQQTVYGRTRITEVKTIDLDCACVENGVYLTWLNPEGGQDYWLFQWLQEHSDEIKETGMFTKWWQDIEQQNMDADWLGKERTPTVTMGANGVPAGKLAGIRGLLDSPKVEMLTNPDTWTLEGPKWVTVRVRPGRYNAPDSRQLSGDIEFTVEKIKQKTQNG